MKTLIATIALILLLLGSTAYGGWYVPPRVVHAYYPAPAYAYPAPVYAYPAPVSAYPAPAYYYRAPIVRPMPYRVYSPVWAGPRGVVVRGRVYIPGRPIRNAVRAVLPY